MESELELICSREIWSGFIPIEFTIAPTDLTSSTPPESFFKLCSRMSYLSQVSVDAIEYLRNYAVDIPSDIWFEHDGVPLKSNIPIGALYDLHSMEIFKESGILPWIVTVHFQSFPYERILKCGSSEESEKYYFHSLKQALYLLHGSTRPFNDLTSEKQSQLWESTYQGSMGMFEQVARDLRPSIENFKFIPLRILFAWDKATYQKPVALFDNDNTYLSVKSYLEPLIHTWEFASAYDILIQGIVVPDDMPLYQIWKLFAHADLFLYICVRPSVKLSS